MDCKRIGNCFKFTETVQVGKCLPILTLGSGGQIEIALLYRLLSSQNLAENNILPVLTLLFCWQHG